MAARPSTQPYAGASATKGRTLAAAVAREDVALPGKIACRVRSLLVGHRHGLTAVAFTADGTLLAASYAETVRA